VGTDKGVAAAPKIVNLSGAPAVQHSSAGSPAPLIAGATLVVALGLGGGAIAWRRRRAG
jgi:hypothetical protein